MVSGPRGLALLRRGSTASLAWCAPARAASRACRSSPRNGVAALVEAAAAVAGSKCRRSSGRRRRTGSSASITSTCASGSSSTKRDGQRRLIEPAVAPVLREGDLGEALGAREADVGEAALLLEARLRRSRRGCAGAGTGPPPSRAGTRRRTPGPWRRAASSAMTRSPSSAWSASMTRLTCSRKPSSVSNSCMKRTSSFRFSSRDCACGLLSACHIGV